MLSYLEMDTTHFFWIYILECEDGSYYTGYTKDLVRRYREHREGTGRAKYTRSFKPVRIARCWRLVDTAGTAMKIERFIKSRERKVKDALVADPGRLKTIIREKLNLDLDVVPFDPLVLEGESAKR